MGQITVIDSLLVSGRTFVGSSLGKTLDNLIILGAYATSNTNATFRRSNATSGYQVPASFKFQIFALSIQDGNAAANGNFDLLYGDTDVGFNAAAGPTNPVYEFGSSAGVRRIPTAGQYAELRTEFYVPAGKYPAVKLITMGASPIQLFGFEIAV